MEKIDVNVRLVEDGGRLAMTTLVGGEPRFETFWSAADVDGFVALLAKLRGDMRDPVAATHDAGSRPALPVDPKMSVARAEQAGDVVLSVRHPGLGWVDWRLTPPHVKAFMFEMLECLKAR